MKVGSIVNFISCKYGGNNDKKPLSKTSMNRYNTIGINKQNNTGTPLSIPMVLLNAMRLHIIVLQLTKKGQASGQIIKGKVVVSASGTEHKGFDYDWGVETNSWALVRGDCTLVRQQESINNEWTTHAKVNNWYTYNKKTLIDSGLAINWPAALRWHIVEVDIVEIETRWIVNYDETDHPLSTVAEKGVSRLIRWEHPDLPNGMYSSSLYYLYVLNN